MILCFALSCFFQIFYTLVVESLHRILEAWVEETEISFCVVPVHPGLVELSLNPFQFRFLGLYCFNQLLSGLTDLDDLLLH